MFCLVSLLFFFTNIHYLRIKFSLNVKMKSKKKEQLQPLPPKHWYEKKNELIFFLSNVYDYKKKKKDLNCKKKKKKQEKKRV